MTWVSTKALAFLGVLGVTIPLVLLVGRVVYALLVEPVAPEVLALDAAVMGAGTLGVLAFMGMHLQDAMARPLADVQARLYAMAAGRLDEPCPTSGPQEVRDLAASVDALAQATERRLHAITQQSGLVAMGSVLNGVAHEVSNPLAHMRLSTDVLLQRARQEDDELGMVILERISRGADRLEDMVKTLRQSGGGRAAYASDRLVKAALIVAQRSILTCNVAVDLQATRLIECVPGDVVQALVALLQNAGEAGGKHIAVRTRDEDHVVVFEVEDDGRGVPAEIAEHAGEAFVTTKAGHAGLGLNRALATAEHLGGSLDRARRDGRTRFVMRVPAAE